MICLQKKIDENSICKVSIDEEQAHLLKVKEKANQDFERKKDELIERIKKFCKEIEVFSRSNTDSFTEAPKEEKKELQKPQKYCGACNTQQDEDVKKN